MSIWEFANPVRFMRFTAWLLPPFAAASALCLAVALAWGFFFTPDDFRQGSTVKIIFLHVPAAFVAINAWLMMLVASLIWLSQALIVVITLIGVLLLVRITTRIVAAGNVLSWSLFD